MVHVVPGLEELAWEELTKLDRALERIATWAHIDRRAGVLLFRSFQPPGAFLRLRFAEDVFSVVGSIRDLPAGRRGPKALADLARTGGALQEALRHHRDVQVRRRHARPTYRVLVRKSGQHAFRRIDAQRACEAGLAKRLPRWRLVEDDAELEFWLQIVGEEAVLALRLSSSQMRHRSYLSVSLPGALKPAVAAALVQLAEAFPGSLLLDPMCGGGTVLAEAAERRLLVLGGDLESKALRAARRNLTAAGAPGRLACWDVGRLPLADESVDAIAANLPWGKQQHPGDLERLYKRFLGEARRVLRPGRRAALLTSQRPLVERLAGRGRHFSIERRLAVVVRGADAWLLALRKRD